MLSNISGFDPVHHDPEFEVCEEFFRDFLSVMSPDTEVISTQDEMSVNLDTWRIVLKKAPSSSNENDPHFSILVIENISNEQTQNLLSYFENKEEMDDNSNFVGNKKRKHEETSSSTLTFKIKNLAEVIDIFSAIDNYVKIYSDSHSLLYIQDDSGKIVEDINESGEDLEDFYEDDDEEENDAEMKADEGGSDVDSVSQQAMSTGSGDLYPAPLSQAIKNNASVSAGSEGSSKTPKVATKEQDNYIVVRPNLHGGVYISTVALRPKTHLVAKQGAHISAYIMNIKAILSSLNAQSISDAPSILLAFGKKFITQAKGKDLEKGLKKFEAQRPLYLTRVEQRIKIAYYQNFHATEQDISEIKSGIKAKNAIYLAEVLNYLGNEVLKGINQSQQAVFDRPGKINRQALGAEGARIKKAMSGLSAIQEVIQYTKEAHTTSNPISIQDLSQESYLRKGLKAFVQNPEPEKKNSQLSPASVKNFVENFYHPELSGRDSIYRAGGRFVARTAGYNHATLDTTARLIVDLFDLHYMAYSASLALDSLRAQIKIKYPGRANQEIRQDFLKKLHALNKCGSYEEVFSMLTCLAEGIVPVPADSKKLEIYNSLINEKSLFTKALLVAKTDASWEVCETAIARHKTAVLEAFPELKQLPEYVWKKVEALICEEQKWQPAFERAKKTAQLTNSVAIEESFSHNALVIK